MRELVMEAPFKVIDGSPSFPAIPGAKRDEEKPWTELVNSLSNAAHQFFQHPKRQLPTATDTDLPIALER